MPPVNRHMIVSICGNIGSGKSTVVKGLGEVGYVVHQEPVSEMTTLLNNFYTDMKKWAFHLQVQVLVLYAKMLPHLAGSMHVVERSPLESKNIFENLLVDDGTMEYDEHVLYNELYDHIGWEPDHIIYLDANPDVCMRRIRKRDRPEEGNISSTYIKQLHDRYLRIKHFRNTHVIDANDNPDIVLKRVVETLNSLQNV